MEFYNVKKLVIDERRWYAHFKLELADGTTKRVTASALDSSGASGDGHYIYEGDEFDALDWT